MDLIKLKRDLIKKEFSRMNEQQFEAVVTVNGPLLVLAGAGSGKTTVLVNRIANLIKYGNAYNIDMEPFLTNDEIEQIEDYLSGKTEVVPNIYELRQNAPQPWQILAITFTNKAAEELKNRLCDKISEGGDAIWAGTFHSTCGKFLRKFGEKLGYTSNYTIYDTNDTNRVIKDCQKRLNIEDKILSFKSIRNEISNAKDSLISPEEYLATAQTDFRKKQIGSVYAEYQKILKSNDAMDFDDMIVNTVKLFEENPDVLEYYQDKFRYIVVDEYQDTNHAQYILIKMLADKYKNICVVGDDDQSIYKFRGATIENILSFEHQYKNAKTIRLEQNYRSTSYILNAANSVISHNQGRKGKNLWTAIDGGDKIRVHTAYNENEEAKFIAEQILDDVKDGMKFSDHAILYRMNAQSSSIENVFARSGVAYKVIGGQKFYDRKEIKDVLSYLQFVANTSDDLRLRRIINEPKRGIGETTVNNAQEIATQLGLSLYEVFKQADQFQKLSRASLKLKTFCDSMDEVIETIENTLPSEILKLLLEKSGYLAALQAQGIEEQDRVDNVNELLTAILHYETETEEPSLTEYLQEVALITDIDQYDEDADRAVMMTLHSAKGLEFPVVFLVGMEEGVFPGNQSIFAGEAEMEEERRLAYVGITRAKKKLLITNASSRMIFGITNHNRPSRFISEIDAGCTEFDKIPKNENATKVPQKDWSSYGAGGFDKVISRRPVTSKPQQVAQSYNIGEKVRHKVFGEGMVLNATKMGNDCLLEIAFDTVGTKKIMANFAKIEKI